ncbi:hypothetical protein BASA61_005728 [Batrachochytrium salamandrivorans]|nr:hypothetical protein BASA61_005728 [Batrachochytrium salamandrivorans]
MPKVFCESDSQIKSMKHGKPYPFRHSNHGKGKPAPSGAFTHRIREDGEIFSGEEGRETSSDTTPLASVAGSVRMRSTDSDRSVRATPKKARDASPPPQDDLWVVVKKP